MTNPDNAGGLLPCPFCGRAMGSGDFAVGHLGVCVVCANCGASSEYLDDRDEATTAWNNRAKNDSSCCIPASMNPIGYVDLASWQADWIAGDSFFTDYQDEDTQPIYTQAQMERAIELCRAAPAGGECALGVGDGSGQLFVHGSYEAIKACQALLLRDSAPAGGDVPSWRNVGSAIDAKALATATEIALMWGNDRSQFVSRIQVAVIDAMRWMGDAQHPVSAPAVSGDGRPDADWYRRNIEREPDDIGAGVPSLASPKGWVMVPAEPTAEMLRAGAIVEPSDSQWGQNYIEKVGARQCWDLMLRAAPKDSAPAGSGEVEVLIDELEEYSEADYKTDCCNDDYPIAAASRVMRTAAALLRKLQQGAE